VTKQHSLGGVTQLNLGSRARIAGRDYYESRIPDSIKVYLATTPSDRLDAETLDNERLFSYRFGVDLPRSVRAQVLKIKRGHELTDRDIRWLRRSGQLQVDRLGAILKPDRVLPLVGWFYAAILAAFSGSMATLVMASGAAAWKQAAGLAAVLVFWGIATWATKQLFISPWLWVRHLVRRRA
jgi:hypothetical protein